MNILEFFIENKIRALEIKKKNVILHKKENNPLSLCKIKISKILFLMIKNLLQKFKNKENLEIILF